MNNFEQKCEVVPMGKVPDPPPSARGGRCAAIYAQVRALGLDQAQALRIPVKDRGDLGYVRARLRKLAEADSRKLLTSRNQGSTLLYAWVMKKDGR